MILDAAVVLLWLAACYRVWVLLTNERTLWRTSFTLSLLAATVAFTLYKYQLQVDLVTGVWNLGNLLSHAALVIGLALLFVYLDTLRLTVVSARRVRAHALIGGSVIVVIGLSWVSAPVHDRPHGDLRGVEGSGGAIVYCLAFWAYLAAGLAMLGWTCLAQGRTFRRHDPARSVSLLVIGVSGFAAIAIVVLWTASLIMSRRPGDGAVVIGGLADRLLPWPLAANAVGVLSLLVVPYLSSLVKACWRWWRLRPLWRELTRRQPEVHLHLTSFGGPLTFAQARAERALIEIRDALRAVRVDESQTPPTDCPFTAIVAALRRHDADGRPAADLLPRVDTRDDDIRQVLTLAHTYREAQTSP